MIEMRGRLEVSESEGRFRFFLSWGLPCIIIFMYPTFCCFLVLNLFLLLFLIKKI